MLDAATFDLAQRKEDVAAEMMETRQLEHELVAPGQVLRGVEQRQRLGESFGNAQPFGQAKLSTAECGLVRRPATASR